MGNAVGASIGTPEHLIVVAQQGRLPKEVLVRFLAVDKRRPYLDACGAIEKRYTEECNATGDPCLEGGCAVEGEVCLQPISARLQVVDPRSQDRLPASVR